MATGSCAVRAPSVSDHPRYLAAGDSQCRPRGAVIGEKRVSRRGRLGQPGARRVRGRRRGADRRGASLPSRRARPARAVREADRARRRAGRDRAPGRAADRAAARRRAAGDRDPSQPGRRDATALQRRRRQERQLRQLRAGRVPADHRRGLRDAAADRAPDDQQVPHRRPRAGAQPRRVPRRPGPSGVLHLLAQPGLRARPLRLRHLCGRRARGPGGGRGNREPRVGQRDGGLLGRDHHRGRARPSGRRGEARRRVEPDAVGVRTRQRAEGTARP